MTCDTVLCVTWHSTGQYDLWCYINFYCDSATRYLLCSIFTDFQFDSIMYFFQIFSLLLIHCFCDFSCSPNQGCFLLDVIFFIFSDATLSRASLRLLSKLLISSSSIWSSGYSALISSLNALWSRFFKFLYVTNLVTIFPFNGCLA